MSVAAMAWAMDQNVPPTPSHVLLILANFADADGVCWPAIATITSKSRLSERAIRDALRVLEEAGCIAKLSAGKGGRATSTRYQLQLRNPAADAGYEKKTRQQAPANGLDTRQETPGKSSQKQQYPAAGAVNPAAGAPDPSRTTSRKGVPPGRDLPLTPRAPAPLPLGWLPSEEDEAFAVATGLDPMATSEAFRDWYHGNVEVRGDWSAVWRTWCRNQRRFDDRDAARRSAPARRETVAGYFARVGSLDADDFADLDDVQPPRRLQ
jgi:hypothetical protein